MRRVTLQNGTVGKIIEWEQKKIILNERVAQPLVTPARRRGWRILLHSS